MRGACAQPALGFATPPARALQWIMFGSGGHMSRPAGGSTLTSYTKCMPPASDVNKHVKVVVQVARWVG